MAEILKVSARVIRLTVFFKATEKALSYSEN